MCCSIGLKAAPDLTLELAQANEQIAKRNAELAQKNNKLLGLQVSESEIIVNQVKFELGLKNSFSNRLVNYLQNNEFDLSNQKLNNIKLFINNEFEDKSLLSGQTGEVNLQFITKLTSRFPDLTETDLNLVSLLIRNFSNKDIAISRNIATSSAKVMKYRLKKKLKLEPEQDLKKFLDDLLRDSGK